MSSLSEAGRRLRDELRVEPTPVDGLRRRRIGTLRRRGALASVAVAATVGGLFAVIGSTHASEHVVVPAGAGVSSTTGSGIGGQTSTRACTLADLERPVPTGMPVPTVVSSPMPIGGGVKVAPPAPGQSISSAAVSAQQVWSHHYLGSVPTVIVQPYPGGGTNEMYLGSFYDSAIGQTRLVWLLERTGVALNPADFLGGPVVSSVTTATTAVRSACRFYTLVVIVDATTGKPLQEGNFLEGSPTISSGTTTPAPPPLPGTTATIPQLAGMSATAAGKAAAAAGITADIISETITNNSPPGTVIAETPLAGTVGTAVSLTIAVPSTAPCTAAQLGLTYLGGGASAGSDGATIALRDTSPAWCNLAGPISVTGLDTSGHAVTSRMSAPIQHPLELSPQAPPPPHGQPPPVGTIYAEIGISAAYRDLPTGMCTSEQVIPTQWQVALPDGATATVANHDASALPFPGLVTCRGQLGPATPVQLASG